MSMPQTHAANGAEQTTLTPELLLTMHAHMVTARVLEERLITMYRQGDGYFWIGGPGEEAFNAALEEDMIALAMDEIRRLPSVSRIHFLE